ETWQLADYGGDKVRQPLRVVLDSRGRVMPTQRVFARHQGVLVVTADKAAQQRVAQRGIASVALGKAGVVDVAALLQELARRECNEVLVDAGATLSAAFLAAGLVDELVVYQAPVLLGQQARPMMALDLASMAEKRCLTLTDQRMVGKD